jgi:hypothetical protein
MKILATLVFFLPWTVSASPAQIIDGNYQRFEGTDFESIFFPCRSTEVWSLEGGKAFDALVDYYRSSHTNKSGEIKFSLQMVVSPIDKAENPNSHIDAVARVIAIVGISEDVNEITSCRAEPQ